MNPSITIIVPIHNTEKYLYHCIDSIRNQTFKDFELLLIDDGSTDNSGKISDAYALCDKRIKVIHKLNTGVSDTRNCALDIAIGKYVVFIDADDYWCVRTALEQLFNVAEKNKLDIVKGEYDIVDEQGNIHYRQMNPKFQIKHMNGLLTSYEFLKYAIHGEFFLWLCLFRREAINSLRFKSGQVFLEDMRFLSTFIAQEVHCMYLPELRFYAYRKNSTSASFSINPLKIKDSLDMCDFFYSLSKNIEKKEMKILYQKMGIKIYYATLETLAIDDYYINCRKYITDFKLNRREKTIRKWISELKLRKYFLSIIYYVPPFIGVYLLRLKHKLGGVRTFVRKIYKSVCY